MKRLLIVSVLLLLAVPGLLLGATITVYTASSTSTYATPTYDAAATKNAEVTGGPMLWFLDSSGVLQHVCASHPLPIESLFALASVTVAVGAPPTTASTASITAGATSAAISALADRTDVSVFNIGTTTIWLNIGGAVATVSEGVPVYAGGYFSRELDATVAVSYVASLTTPGIVHQSGY